MGDLEHDMMRPEVLQRHESRALGAKLRFLGFHGALRSRWLKFYGINASVVGVGRSHDLMRDGREDSELAALF